MSNDAAWRALVERYADGRPICNCREAFAVMVEAVGLDGEPVRVVKKCEDGCSAALIRAKHEIGRRALEEITAREWRPVTDTEPPDDLQVLVWYCSDVELGSRWHSATEGRVWWIGDATIPDAERPSHWMPLPPPPRTE